MKVRHSSPAGAERGTNAHAWLWRATISRRIAQNRFSTIVLARVGFDGVLGWQRGRSEDERSRRARFSFEQICYCYVRPARRKTRLLQAEPCVTLIFPHLITYGDTGGGFVLLYRKSRAAIEHRRKYAGGIIVFDRRQQRQERQQ